MRWHPRARVDAEAWLTRAADATRFRLPNPVVSAGETTGEARGGPRYPAEQA